MRLGVKTNFYSNDLCLNYIEELSYLVNYALMLLLAQVLNDLNEIETRSKV